MLLHSLVYSSACLILLSSVPDLHSVQEPVQKSKATADPLAICDANVDLMIILKYDDKQLRKRFTSGAYQEHFMVPSGT